MGKKHEIICDSNTGLSALLSVSIVGLSRAKADILIKSGEVKVNGTRVRTNSALEKGDTVSVFVPDSLVASISIARLYDDANIVVFSKPKHVPFDRIPELVGEALYPVHRLDTNTCGVIAFARTLQAKNELERAFLDRRTQKIYEAVVSPPPKKDSDTLVAYTSMGLNNVANVFADRQPGAKQMITEYSVVKRYAAAALLRIELHTGRTHQIRAHMKYIGSPIVGDPKYGGAKPNGAPDTQMLTAVELRFSGLGGGLEYLNGRLFSTDNGFDLDFLN